MKTKKNNVGKIASFGVMLLLGLFPLFLTNGYFNITISKALFFCAVSFVFAALCGLVGSVSKRHYFKNTFSQKKLTDIAFAVFGISAFLSLVFSQYKGEAFSGSNGRYMGFVYILALLAAYCFISKHYVLRERELLIYAVVAAAVSIIAVIQFCGFNPFGLLTGIPINKKHIYFSTIGNSNVFTSYLSLTVPFSAYMYSRDVSVKRFIYLFSAAVGSFALFVSCSDSGYIGFIAGTFFAAVLLFDNSKALGKLSLGTALFFALACLFGVVSDELSGVNKIFCDLKIALPLMCLFAVIALVLIKKRISTGTLKKAKRIFIAFSVVLIAAAVGSFIYFSFIDTETNIGFFEDYLRFSNEWGTERGNIWKRIAAVYSDFSPLKKLFGSGEDTILIVMREKFETQMAAQGHYTDSAHNGFLQYLVTQGAVGLAAYIFVLVSCIKTFVSNRNESDLYKGLIIPVAAYLAQDMVNITQPLTTPLLFVFLALISGKRTD